MRKAIVKVLNKLYISPIQKIVPKQSFFYAMCGGGNMLFDAILYLFIYNFVLNKTPLIIFNYEISAAIASFLITFPFVFCLGLWLAKNITFTNSDNSDKKQSFRYLSVTIANFFIKYYGIKALITLSIWPSFANIAMTIITIVFSYLMQKYYTFKGNKFD